jgi:hypothetical protein
MFTEFKERESRKAFTGEYMAILDRLPAFKSMSGMALQFVSSTAPLQSLGRSQHQDNQFPEV